MSLISATQWYPIFVKNSIKSAFIAIDNEFIEYLAEDGIIMPQLKQDIFQKDQLSDDDTYNDEEDIPVMGPNFKDLNTCLTNIIEKFDGKVFVKLNSKCPSDAGWINAGTLACTTAGDIYLLLKASTRVR